MEKLVKIHGLVVPIDRYNVDTDLIIPKQFLKSINRIKYGQYLFDEIRYLDEGYIGKDCSKRIINQSFVLNKKRYIGGSILLSRANFGSGSSREHAIWAIKDYGFKVIIAPSFADIFFNNSFKNGLLPIKLSTGCVNDLFISVLSNEGYSLTVNLIEQLIIMPDRNKIKFKIDQFRKYCLLNGLDDINLTLNEADSIIKFEINHRNKNNWLFND
ncbi:3-isopropylmalate dehydratase small subunit [Candidatus Johnevansia muelleri]|uniref:3-isopropylmalate dehydratase small subunit n=1 Tax=Candidatus Johnevansia muelleri TaxID=1495769 RepID=A0A078KHR5_9GAMM|nr:3-isopropylmalate dehydratase small subunit [Candidatus Evansia muelleri]